MSESPDKQMEYFNGPDQILPSDILKTWEPTGAVKLKVEDQGLFAYTPISVPTLLKKAVDKFPAKSAMCVKRDGVWKATTYSEYYDQVRTMAKAFIKLGLEQFHGVCILGFNSPEWFISDLAAIFAGGFAAGLYTSNTPEACEYCARNCEAQIWVVENQSQLDKVLKIRERLPKLSTIIQYSGEPTVEGVMSWDEAMALGRAQPESDLEERMRHIAINQCCTLIYTSGTTGAPKGVMLSHDNLTYTAYLTCINLSLVIGDEEMISFLPLSHIAAQMIDIYTSIHVGGTIYFAQPDALKGSLGATIREIRPTWFMSVPRVWEKMYEKMMEVGRLTKEVLGLDRARNIISGAAPIAADIIRYFHSCDIILAEVYGMSECTGPHSCGVKKAIKIGSCGPMFSGVHMKFNNSDKDGNGEIYMGGRHVAMGYLRMEDKTQEAIDDEGWLHSGDIGMLDSEDFLFITGRLKELIITAGGENIPPVLIENTLKGELPCLSNCMLIGDTKKFISILLTLKTNVNLETGEPLDSLSPSCIEWCRSIGSEANTIQDVLSDDNVTKAIQEGVDKANKLATSNAQRIQKWTILPKDFSIPGEELGPTLKLKRSVVVKKYNDVIESLYEV